MAKTKLEAKLSEYGDWVKDARDPGSKFLDIPLCTMSTDDLFAVIGIMNHMLHQSADENKRLKTGGGGKVILPKGYTDRFRG